MLIPTRLTVCGFRGFTSEQTFEFSTPATILSGENHCGKSSTLNALEWCLFGDQCEGQKTNIRERVGWVIPNQYLERPDVLVELRLIDTDSDGEIVVRRRLHARHGAREFGKIVQKLLAIAFRFAGFVRVVERGVQGVDVDAVGDLGERYATEVKTTQKAAIAFASKDRNGLTARQQDGYHPLLAVLRLTPLSDLLVVRTATLRCGHLQIASLHPHRFHELEERLQPCFARAVLEHFEGAYTGAQFYLDKVLREFGVEVIDPAPSVQGGLKNSPRFNSEPAVEGHNHRRAGLP